MLGNIYEAKPKYELWEKLLFDKITDIRLNENVNVIVDLKQVYRKIFRSSFVLDSIENSYLEVVTEEIVADIIGIISHYRNFFAKTCGKYTKFYFVYSEKECEYFKNIFPEYKEDYYFKYFKDPENMDKIKLSKRITKALKFVLNLIPNAEYIDSSDFDELVYMKYIVESSKQNEFNLILSNDELIYSLLNYHTYALDMKGVDTHCITNKNVYDILSAPAQFSHSLYIILMSITGIKKYSIPGIYGHKYLKTVKLIEELLKNNYLENSRYLVFPLIKEQLDSNIKILKPLIENFDTVKFNFDLFNFDKVLNENRIAIYNKFVKNNPIVSVKTFEELNQRVFRNFPLNINHLLKGELL